MENTQLIIAFDGEKEVWRHEALNETRANAFIQFFYDQKHLENLTHFIWHNLSGMSSERIDLKIGTRKSIAVTHAEAIKEFMNRNDKNYL